jgi:hypothetical protein
VLTPIQEQQQLLAVARLSLHSRLTLNEGSSKQGKALRAAMDSNCVDAMTRVSLAASAAAATAVRSKRQQQQLLHTAAGSQDRLF